MYNYVIYFFQRASPYQYQPTSVLWKRRLCSHRGIRKRTMGTFFLSQQMLHLFTRKWRLIKFRDNWSGLTGQSGQLVTAIATNYVTWTWQWRLRARMPSVWKRLPVSTLVFYTEKYVCLSVKNIFSWSKTKSSNISPPLAEPCGFLLRGIQQNKTR